MRLILVLIIIIHSLIHLLGFVKAFGIYNVQQLTQTIPKSVGVIWLIAFCFFLISATLLAFNDSYWLLFGSVAIIISQLLIFKNWQDAKFGTIINVIILIGLIIGYATWNYYNKYKNDVKLGLQQEEYFNNSVITETDIEHLPEPVKKYLHYTGSIGKPKVNNFKIEFTGKIRKDEQSEWMPFTSEQYNFMKTPTRLFFMNAVMKHLPVAGYHSYANGNAFMDIRLLSLFKVQFQDGDEMNKAETVTFFNDMCCMAPATLIDKRILWETISENTVKATFTNNKITIHAILSFNEAGQLINFTSNDRYNADAGKKLPWATPLKDYKEINGYNLARYAEAIYTYPDRDLCYGVFQTTSIKYNIK